MTWRLPVTRTRAEPSTEAGSALVEVVWLGILLLVPLVWIVLSVFEVQRGAFGVTDAARAAGRAFALAPDDAAGRRQAEAVARRALADQGLGEAPVSVRVTCTPYPAHCHSGTSVITVRVASRVQLPLLPAVLGGGTPSFALDASHTVPIGQYQEITAGLAGARRPRGRSMSPRPRAPRATARRDEQGQVTLLIIGFAFVLLVGIAVVVDATAAYLQRSGLSSLADGAALHGADLGATGRDVYEGGVPEDRLALSADVARAGVGEYLRAVGAHRRYPGLSYSVAIDPAASRVTVRLTAPLDLPLSFPGSPARASVGATGSAVSLVDQTP